MKTELDAVLNKMNQAVQGSTSYWVAQHGDKFRHDFATFVQKANSQLNTVLEEASKATGQNLQAIETATYSSFLWRHRRVPTRSRGTEAARP